MAAAHIVFGVLAVVVILAIALVASRIPAFIQDERDHRDLRDFEVGP